MFSTIDSIDNFCINLAQWIVRQVELYTSIERKGLLNYCLFLLKGFIVGLVLSIILNLLVSPHLALILASLVVPIFIFDYIIFKILIKDQERSNWASLPHEIITRKAIRLVHLFSFLVATGVLSEIIISLVTDVFLPRYLIIIFICSIFVIEFCLDLLLCTVSLPPGEKQKKVTEKELRDMEPSIQN